LFNQISISSFISLVFRGKLQASVDQYKAYEKTIRDAKETVKANDQNYNEEVAKRDAIRSDTASLKLKVKFLIVFQS
jgi:hypothetical protein